MSIVAVNSTDVARDFLKADAKIFGVITRLKSLKQKQSSLVRWGCDDIVMKSSCIKREHTRS